MFQLEIFVEDAQKNFFLLFIGKFLKSVRFTGESASFASSRKSLSLGFNFSRGVKRSVGYRSCVVFRFLGRVHFGGTDRVVGESDFGLDDFGLQFGLG